MNVKIWTSWSSRVLLVTDGGKDKISDTWPEAALAVSRVP